MPAFTVAPAPLARLAPCAKLHGQRRPAKASSPGPRQAHRVGGASSSPVRVGGVPARGFGGCSRALRGGLVCRSSRDDSGDAQVTTTEKPSTSAVKAIDGQPYSGLETFVETILFNSRFLAIFGVAGCLISSVTMYCAGLQSVLQASSSFFYHALPWVPEITVIPGEMDAGEISAFVVESMDNFMLATVLLVFGLGLYELFVSEIDDEVIEGMNGFFSLNDTNSRPGWLKTKGLDDLKIKLGKVVVMIFLVKTLGFLQHIEVADTKDLLQASEAILAASLSLFLAGLGINPWKQNSH